MDLDYSNVLFVTVLHGERSLRTIMENLTKCVAKKIKRGEAVYRDILANSSSVRQLVRDAKKWHVKSGGEVWWGREYEQEARTIVATEILSDACEIINS